MDPGIRWVICALDPPGANLACADNGQHAACSLTSWKSCLHYATAAAYKPAATAQRIFHVGGLEVTERSSMLQRPRAGGLSENNKRLSESPALKHHTVAFPRSLFRTRCPRRAERMDDDVNPASAAPGFCGTEGRGKGGGGGGGECDA
ncbi:hypothetical protein DIPPA_23634 [Diplonema papillatum]|nr:hypothetical protein DIPPA_23634 [Diplonema papillatum]